MSESGKFKTDSAFTQELKHEVRQIFENDPHGRYANFSVFAKAIALLTAMFALYILLVFFSPSSFIVNGVLLLALSVVTVLVGFNVMHEGAHGSFSKKQWINQIFATAFDLFGVSSDLYKIKHVYFHHTFTNIYGYDGDVSEAPMLRMTPQQRIRGIHRWQAFFAPVLYGMVTMAWYFGDLFRMRLQKVGTQKFSKPSVATQLKIVLFKAIHLSLAILIPCYFHSFQTVISAFLIYHFVTGLMVTLVFQAAHVVQKTTSMNSIPDQDWHLHQIATTADFATESRMACWLLGGLNFQTIHHLFPNVSYRHFPAIQKILLRLAQKHRVEYLCYPSFSGAITSHFKELHQLGQSEVIS